jgi:hypothetical protein
VHLFNIHTWVSRSDGISAKKNQFATGIRNLPEDGFDYSTEEIPAVWLALTKLCNDCNPTKSLILIAEGIDWVFGIFREGVRIWG